MRLHPAMLRLTSLLMLGGAVGCAGVTIARNPNADVNSVRRIAVAPFADDAAQTRIAGEWQTMLTAFGYRIIERGDIGLIMKEHGLSLMGLVDPAQAPKIGELLGVEGILLGRPGPRPYHSYDMLGQPQIAEPPARSVKLVDAKTARVVWNLTSEEGGEHADRLTRQGIAVSGKLRIALHNTLSSGGWAAFPSGAFQRESGSMVLAFNPEMKHSVKLRIGVYPFKAEDEEKSQEWAEKMSHMLLDVGYDVVDRTQLQDLMKEHKLSLSGVVKPEQMAEMGKLAGIQALVFGAIYGDPVCAYSARLADLQTGELYWSAYGTDCQLDHLSSSMSSFLRSQGKN